MGVGPPAGAGPHSLLTPSPYFSWVDLAAALTRVDTTSSVTSTPLAYLLESPVYSPGKTQYPPPRPLICDMYPPPATFSLHLSGCVPRSRYGPAGSRDPLSRQSALMTHLISTVA